MANDTATEIDASELDFTWPRPVHKDWDFGTIGR
jgi:hypothetical protein